MRNVVEGATKSKIRTVHSGRLRSLLHTRLPLAMAPKSFEPKNRGSTKKDGCGREVVVSPHDLNVTMPRLLGLLAMDYICLGYPAPPGMTMEGGGAEELARAWQQTNQLMNLPLHTNHGALGSGDLVPPSAIKTIL